MFRPLRLSNKRKKENFCGLAHQLFLQVHVNIADPTQLSVVDSGYVDDKLVIFHILNRD